jgi:hypothetical protein
MTANSLRDELVRVDTIIEATKQDEAEAHAEIRALARLAIQPDAKDALAKIKQLEGKLGSAKMAIRRLLDAREQISTDLAEAIAQEAQSEREKDASEAEAFAESLPNIFAQCDHHFGEFHRSFSAAIAAINTARSAGWNVPSQELFQAKLIRALRTRLSVGELAMLGMPPLPSPERTTFAQLGESYSKAVRGGARHSLTPPPTLQPLPQQTAAKSEDFRMPPRIDIGMKMVGDGPDFEVRIPTAR